MNEVQLYAWKACALLLPSPFAWIDPPGEAARQDEIRAWLKGAGVDLGTVDQGHLKKCAVEAHDALIPPAASEQPPSARDIPLLRHPLSAERLLRRGRRIEPAAQHEHLLGALNQLKGPPDGRWYRRLWRTVMRHPSYRDLPANARLPDHTVAAHRSLTAALAGATLGDDRPALLAVHVGPVQSFIEAARRTHDLSIGSYTVGFLAFAAARMLARELGPDVLIHPDVSKRMLADQLIFEDPPSVEDRPELLRAALVNRILAVVPDRRGDEIAREAARSVTDTWRAMGKATRKHLERHAAIDERDFDAQIEAHLDLDLVVQRWPGTNAEIKKLLEDAGLPREPWLEETVDHPGAACGALIDLTERTLAAHRMTLTPVARDGDHRPKCTVCGLREQVGRRVEAWNQQFESRRFFETLSKDLQQRDGRLRDSLQIVRGEGLCAVCLTKRFAPEVYYGAADGELGLDWRDREGDRPLLRFPSTASIASAPLRFYLQKVAGRNRDLGAWLDRLQDLHGPDRLNFTPPRNLLGGLGPIGDDARLLAHDGTWLYDSTYETDVVWRNHFTSEPEEDHARYGRIASTVRDARTAFASARRAAGGKSASPYYAVIALDGDKMGDWKAGCHARSPTIGEIAASDDQGAHIPSDDLAKRRPVHPALYGELSRRVADLGLDLHQIVDRHLGRLVYHGGDDLLALVPLATALHCLEKIRQSIQSSEHLGNRVTISAGVAVSHWRDPLGRALEAARRAERSAKRRRSRFAIHADKRSGETLEIVLPWTMETNRGVLAVIPTLLETLARGGSEEPPLAGAKAAYQLRDELPALGHEALRDAFLQRVNTLVFAGHTDTSGPRALFHALLSDSEAGAFKDRADRIVDLLLLLRFLLREEHGIVTAELLGDLAAKEDLP